MFIKIIELISCNVTYVLWVDTWIVIVVKFDYHPALLWVNLGLTSCEDLAIALSPLLHISVTCCEF